MSPALVLSQDLETKKIHEELVPEVVNPAGGKKKAVHPSVLSVAWSADGQTLFAGYSDNVIRVWTVQA